MIELALIYVHGGLVLSTLLSFLMAGVSAEVNQRNRIIVIAPSFIGAAAAVSEMIG